MIVKHRPGKQMAHVDALSRYPVEESDEVKILMTVNTDDYAAMIQRKNFVVVSRTRLFISNLNGDHFSDSIAE